MVFIRPNELRPRHCLNVILLKFCFDIFIHLHINWNSLQCSSEKLLAAGSAPVERIDFIPSIVHRSITVLVGPW